MIKIGLYDKSYQGVITFETQQEVDAFKRGYEYSENRVVLTVDEIKKSLSDFRQKAEGRPFDLYYAHKIQQYELMLKDLST